MLLLFWLPLDFFGIFAQFSAIAEQSLKQILNLN